MIPPDTHLQIGSLLFEGLDQIVLAGPTSPLQRRMRDLHAAAQHATIHRRHYVAAGRAALAQVRSRLNGDRLLAAE